MRHADAGYEDAIALCARAPPQSADAVRLKAVATAERGRGGRRRPTPGEREGGRTAAARRPAPSAQPTHLMWR